MTSLRPIFISGHAGTGKTFNLMKRTGQLGSTLIQDAAYQSVLAITHMHGARRRVEGLLKKEHASLPVRVSTIHAFAADIANRWRCALGYDLPILVNPDFGGLQKRYGFHHASFEEIISMALQLVNTKSVSEFIASTHPLIIVDELQDCTGLTLELINKLAGISQMLVAGDDFQRLDCSAVDAGCEAFEWLSKRKQENSIEHIELLKPWRTNATFILESAQCLRNNIPSTKLTIPKYWAPKAEQLAWKILPSILKGMVGTYALICVSNGLQVQKLISELDKLLAQKTSDKNSKVNWSTTLKLDLECEKLYDELKIDQAEPESRWKPVDVSLLSGRALMIQNRIERFSKLAGQQILTMEFVAQFAQRSLHAERSYAPIDRKYEITTIHGAKNREFDHVFVFWDYSIPPDPEKQRRLLYNAITRAKQTCFLLVQRSNEQAVSQDPVLRLLGQYDFFVKRTPKKKAARQA